MSNRERFEEAKKKLFLEVQDKVRGAAISLQSKILLKAPVDKGELRKPTNWPMTEENPYSFVIVPSDNPKKINTIEYGLYPNPPKGGEGKTEGGFSKKAPEGFIRISIEEVANEFK